MSQQEFRDYWEKVCEAHPVLRDERKKLDLTVGEFRMHLERAYLLGQYQGTPVAEALTEVFR